ncbi:MAG: tetratricopeptide repeat protein [Anaerolineales bacterium]|nr:tetratricopeptide repeat protein [Anaerolineales bacterium]
MAEEEDILFQEAVEALRQKDKAKAKNMLTQLLKSDQKNVQYWIWLSAAVESTKERIYCLQTAHQLDPENATAKRGLVLLGAIPPDESVQPFPLNRPRLWDEELALASDQPKEKRTFKSVISSPVGRLAGFGIIGIAIITLVVFGLILPNSNPLAPRGANTAGPSPTYTLTPTFVNATAQAPVGRGTLVPLAELLEAPHTPTPLYVNTPRGPLSADQNRMVKAAYERGDWDTVITGMLEIARNEPEAADPYYYIGEAYRFKGDYRNALDAYNEALRINPDFGPPYLGLARVRLLQEPNLDANFLFVEALKRDPNFGEVYLERAMFYLNRLEPELALADLKTAERLLPGSPLVYYYEARANIILDNLNEAETAALKANEADPTMLSVYFTLGEIYLAKGENAKAIDVLQTYTGYETRNATARAMLGEAYYKTGDCEAAIDALGSAISTNPSQRQAYLYRGLCYLREEEIDKAKADLERAQQYYQDDFRLNLSLMRISMLQERFGDAYLQGETVLTLAKTDEEKALAYYWRALNFEEREEVDNAAVAWQELLALPANAMTRQMRTEAQEHLAELNTATPTLTKRPVTPSATRTATLRSGTATRTPTPSRTPTPTRTPTLTKTRTPTPTRTPSPTPTP